MRCSREGCSRPISALKPGRRYCTFACRAINFELEATQRVCTAVGSIPATAGLYGAVVALNAALDEYQRLDRELFDAARGVGITSDQFYAIKYPRREKPTVPTQLSDE